MPLSLSQHQFRGTLLVAFSGMLYGVIGYFGTMLFHEHFSVSAMLFWRFFIAAVWMFFSTLLLRKNIFKYVNTHTGLIKTILFGSLCYSAASAFYFLASQHIGTGMAMVIFFSFPIFVTLFSWVLTHWQMNKYAFSSLIAVTMGLVLLKGHGDHALDVAGIGLAMIASLFYATYIYNSQHSAKAIDSRLLTMLICIFNAMIFLVLMLYTHSFAMPVTLNAWVYISAIGVIATAIPIQLLLSGMKYISPVKASILSVLEPVVTVLVGLALLDEAISYTQAFGIMIVLLGAILIQFERKLPNKLT